MAYAYPGVRGRPSSQIVRNVPPPKPDYFGEWFQSRRTGKFHWRLRRRENKYIVANSTGGKGRGYARKDSCIRAFRKIHGDRYELVAGKETR